MKMEIRYLKNEEIDKRRWDETIQESPQGRVYAYSWYLDCMSPSWDALVGGDYDAVFPLPYTENIPGVKRVFQPRVCQQLGLFLKDRTADEKLLGEFLRKIPAHFRSVDISLAEGTVVSKLDGWQVTQRVNMILPLSKEYQEIETGFSEHHRRNIRKSKGADIIAMDNISPEEFVNSFLEELKGRIRNYTDAQRNGLIALIKVALKNNAGFIRVLGDRTGRILSAAFFLESHGRIYYALPFSSSKGREAGAMYKLLDAVFWENSGKSVTFDFEGSSLEGVARFNKGFGAQSVSFYRIFRENLPWWVRILLRIRKFFRRN